MSLQSLVVLARFWDSFAAHAHSLLPSSLYLLCPSTHALHSPKPSRRLPRPTRKKARGLPPADSGAILTDRFVIDSRPFVKQCKSQPATIIQVRTVSESLALFEALGVQPVFLTKEHAITYAKERAWFRSGEIRVLDAAGHIESAIPFDETDRKL
jgi:hypothetical protein